MWIPAVLLAATASAAAPAPTIPAAALATAARLRDDRSGSQAFAIVESLTTQIGPRPAGWPSYDAAVHWAVLEMGRLGLTNVTTEAAPVRLWERGEASATTVGPLCQPMEVLALGGSVGTRAAGPDGVEAEVIRAADIDELATFPRSAVEGRIVFLDPKMRRTRDGAGYAETVRNRGRGASEAAKLGAVAMVVRSIGTDDARAPHTGWFRYAPDAPKIPAAALSIPDADLLAAKLARGPVRFRLRLGAREAGTGSASNVLGEVPGRDPAAGIVLLGAHLDSWEPGTGANDDGAGIAIVLEAARRIAALPVRPRRTIRVVLFANEEFGLDGAKTYAELHDAELPRHTAAIEADSGSGPVYEVASHVRDGATGILAPLAALLAPLGIAKGENDSGGGADLSPLIPKRVPVFSLRQDVSLYFDTHHTANDVLANVDRTGLEQAASAYAAFAWAIAEVEGELGPAGEEEGKGH